MDWESLAQPFPFVINSSFVAHERFREELKQLGILYSKTKKFVLNAEEVDPDASSNIPAIGEHRYALDHVMRALWEYFEKGSEADEILLCGQIENARGHMFRAAYDALDGAGISYKLRMDRATKGMSNDAIAAVYPSYYQTDLPEIYKLQSKIAEHRNRKDEQNRTMQDLDDYCATVDRVNQISTEVTSKIPAVRDWQRRNRWKKIVEILWIPIVVAFFAALFLVGMEVLKDKYFQPGIKEVTPPRLSPGPSPAPSPKNRAKSN